MIPQEKADDLFRKMYQVRSVAPSDITKYFAKQSALVAVDEILDTAIGDTEKDYKYWAEVKQELEKL